jgi:hypothetical protein
MLPVRIGYIMVDPYSRLAALLWFLPSQRLEVLLAIAESMVVENFRASVDEWTAC